jgi:hypothetical protein
MGIAAGLALAAAFTCAHAQNGSRNRASGANLDPTVISFVLGNVEFLLLHEIGHFLIAEKSIPIIGPEENAADYIATLALIREEPLDSTRQDRALKFLVSAADAFAIAWQAGNAAGAEIPYWEGHALSIQRYYQVACLLYGSDPVVFERVPQVAGLPEDRARGCIAEYERADESIEWLLATYGRQPGDPPGAETEIVYEQPRTLVATRIVTELQAVQLLERTIERLHVRFALERPFKLVMRGCGQGEAAWIPERRELVICYDLIDRLYLLGLRSQAGPLQPIAPAE